MYLLLAASVLAVSPPLFRQLDHWGLRDWDQFTFRYETPRTALLRDHVLPLWNPYVNGGTVLLAHPDCPVTSPWYLLVLTLGAPLGLRVQVVLFMLLGVAGMATLLRHWGAGPAGSFTGGVILMMSSHFLLHVTEGHMEWCVLALMPWLVLSLERIPGDLRFIPWSALLLSSVLLFGSVYIVAVYVPFLSIWTVFEAVRTRRIRLVSGWILVLVLTSAISAVATLNSWSGHSRGVPGVASPIFEWKRAM